MSTEFKSVFGAIRFTTGSSDLRAITSTRASTSRPSAIPFTVTIPGLLTSTEDQVTGRSARLPSLYTNGTMVGISGASPIMVCTFGTSVPKTVFSCPSFLPVKTVTWFDFKRSEWAVRVNFPACSVDLTMATPLPLNALRIQEPSACAL
ncbi:Uncharacterised protein [Streptococcus pneumoniae]|nr:Uncharacterised protein [Streptococcus pneumoniae]